MTVVLRIGLALLAAVMLIVGAWNQFWPESFYTDFPTVDLTPPFTEHFARDFGGTTPRHRDRAGGGGDHPAHCARHPRPARRDGVGIPHFVFHLHIWSTRHRAKLVFVVIGTGSPPAAAGAAGRRRATNEA